MNKLRLWYKMGMQKYKLISSKKYTTLAGTLVFFLIMSIVPLSFWLSLLIAKLPVDTNLIFDLPVFDSVKNVIEFVRTEATNATTSVSVILLVTTLYSSTNFFYQMRRSGEIIYDYRREKQAFRLRVSALALMLVVLFSIVIFLLLFAFCAFLFSKLPSAFWERALDYALLTCLSFFLVLLLNLYVCPYRAPLKHFLLGTWVTVTAWGIAVLGFSAYIRISNIGRLYGALSTLILFLLWLYALMICFIVGVILNSEKITREMCRTRRSNKTRRK